MKPNIVHQLTKLESKYGCHFYLPPYNKQIDKCAFDITELKDDAIKFHDFMVTLKKMKVPHEFSMIKKKNMIVLEI
jgi:hypothetical protein